MKERILIKQAATAFIIVLSIICPAVPASAKVKSKTAKIPAKCSGAWTGNVRYTKTYSRTDSKVTKRVSMRGEDNWNFEMKADYSASVAVVEAPERNGTNIGKARVEYHMTSIDKTTAREENSCDKGKTFQVMGGVFLKKSETKANAGGLEANVTVGVNDNGTYGVSIGIPDTRGETTGSESATYHGQCKAKESKNVAYPSTEVKVDGHSMTSNGTHRIEPTDPNRISGTSTQSGFGVTETISWNLERCGAPLRISNLKFEDMRYPVWNDWKEIDDTRGTIDGNFVRIKATVLNETGESKYADLRLKETYKGDKWNGARPDAPLSDNVASVRVDPGSESEVEFIWDSSGFAWFDDGRPRLLQRIKAELEENGKVIDEETRNLKVAPRPLVLVHGLWSNWTAFAIWQNLLTMSHSYDWKAYPVGEKPEHGLLNVGGEFLSTTPTASIGDNARQLENYIEFAQKDRNAWHVDLVAHSMGGLVSRYYISQIMNNNSEDGKPRVSRLFMLGTPNLGSPCADVMNVVFETLQKNVEAVRQMRQDYVDGFNRVNTQRKGVKFSALAGNPLPNMCKQIVWNDGVVSVPSAKWVVTGDNDVQKAFIKDTAESDKTHNALMGTGVFYSFVKPRLVIGPKGDHAPAVPEMPTTIGGNDNSSFFVNVSYGNRVSANPLADFRPDFAKAVKLAPKSSVDIDVPVSAAPDLGVTFMALSDVSVTLLDQNGRIVGKNLAGTPEASGWFRSIYVDEKVTAGTWKLRLENTSDRELEAVFGTWNGALRATNSSVSE